MQQKPEIEIKTQNKHNKLRFFVLGNSLILTLWPTFLVWVLLFFSFSNTFRRRKISYNLFHYNKYKQYKYKEKWNIIWVIIYTIIFVLLTIILLQIYFLKVWNATTFPFQNPQELTSQIFYEIIFYRVTIELIFISQSTTFSHQSTTPLNVALTC